MFWVSQLTTENMQKDQFKEIYELSDSRERQIKAWWLKAEENAELKTHSTKPQIVISRSALLLTGTQRKECSWEGSGEVMLTSSCFWEKRRAAATSEPSYQQPQGFTASLTHPTAAQVPCTRSWPQHPWVTVWPQQCDQPKGSLEHTTVFPSTNIPPCGIWGLRPPEWRYKPHRSVSHPSSTPKLWWCTGELFLWACLPPRHCGVGSSSEPVTCERDEMSETLKTLHGWQGKDYEEENSPSGTWYLS